MRTIVLVEGLAGGVEDEQLDRVGGVGNVERFHAEVDSRRLRHQHHCHTRSIRRRYRTIT